MTRSAIRALFAGAIDYAGLFPPAALPMSDAVRNYAAYLRSDDAWALGRFVVPVARLAEFRHEVRDLPATSQPEWRLSALAGPGGATDWDDVKAPGDVGAVIDAFELRVPTAEGVQAAAARLPANLDVFYEIPIDADPGELVIAIAQARGKAKVRTGGVTADAFPAVSDLARFLVACARAAVPFKATAGLHHPLRAAYPLTYAPDSPRGEMFGFVNVFLAAALARAGAGEDTVAALLVERDASAFGFGADGVAWRDRRIAAETRAETRGGLAVSFGSCSFREPLEELEALGLL